MTLDRASKRRLAASRKERSNLHFYSEVVATPSSGPVALLVNGRFAIRAIADCAADTPAATFTGPNVYDIVAPELSAGGLIHFDYLEKDLQVEMETGFELYAVDSYGRIISVPAVPTIGVATPGNASASITFTPAASNIGGVIDRYMMVSTPGGFSGFGTNSPIVVSGLDNGTEYTFKVHASNSFGDSPESAASNAVTPVTVPDAPTIGAAVAGDTTAEVSFTPPAEDGSTAITGYVVVSDPDSITGSGLSSPITVTDLVNGTDYSFTVYATNAVGDGTESESSNVVTPEP